MARSTIALPLCSLWTMAHGIVVLSSRPYHPVPSRHSLCPAAPLSHARWTDLLLLALSLMRSWLYDLARHPA